MKRSGFTMTEILVVIIIIGIIAAASAPVFLKVTRLEKLKSGAKYIASSLKSARSYAIARRVNYVVNLYLGVDSNIGVYKKAIEIYETPDFKKFIYLSQGSKLTDGSNDTTGIIEYTFTSTGQASVSSPTGDNTSEVRVKNMEGDTSDESRYYRIRLYGLTGQVTVEGPCKKDGTLE